MTVASHAELAALRKRIGRDAYLRACRRACWEAGDLSYALNDSQRALREMFYSRRARRYVAKIARRWGKTRTCSVLAFESALRGPSRRILYAAQTQTAVKEFVAPHFLELAGDAPDHLRPELVANEMRFRNGSRIVLQGCEDTLKADRLRGPAAHDAFVDEGGFIPVLRYVVTSVIRPQLSTTRGTMLIASSPPEAPDHDFEDFAVEAETKGAYMRRDIYDAPHVPPEEVAQWCEDVGGADSIAWMREGLAMSVTDPTRAVLPEFSQLESSIVVDSWDRPEYFHALIVGDLGYVDMTVIALGYYDFERATLVIEDEVSLRRPTSDIIQREASAKAESLWGSKRPLVRKLDGPGITVGDVARLESTPLAEGGSGERWQTVFNGELSQAVNALRVMTKRGRVRVHRRCKTIIAHARSARWNTPRTSFERVTTDEGQHHYDGCAALVYMAREARTIEGRNPAPLLAPGVHPHLGMRVPPELMADPRRERIRQAFKPRRERR